jgi:N-acetylglucosaminyldiphosphoundecaprenol N-acetyl-beta-D-mannosaminyltransferase
MRQDNMSTNLHHLVAVLGLPLANVTTEEAVDSIENLILSGGTHQVATANLDFWVNSLADVDLHRIIAGCSLVLADGMPLVWISHLLRTPLKERVSGVDLVPRLAELSARKGYRIFLLGGRPGVATRASEVLKQMYPGVNIVGHYAPPVADLERLDHGDTLERIRAAKPDLLLVAFGNPKQEKWIRMHSRRLGVPVSIGIGGSMDILIGNVQRAPKWMRNNGLEWLGRCIQEPSRLLPRYLRNFGGLASRLPVAFLASFLQRSQNKNSAVSVTSDSGVVHVHIEGKLDGEASTALEQATASCISENQLLIVHMQKLTYASPKGLGSLLAARQRMLASGLSLSLAGVPARFKLLLSAWCLEPLFDEFRIPQERRPLVTKLRQPVLFTPLVGNDANLPAKSESQTA